MASDSNQPTFSASDLGVRLFDTPPSSFRPQTATSNDLKNFGMLQRPTNDFSAEYRPLWDRMYSGRFNSIVPQFKRRITKTTMPPRHNAPSAVQGKAISPVQPVAPSPIQYPNWGGIAIARGQQ